MGLQWKAEQSSPKAEESWVITVTISNHVVQEFQNSLWGSLERFGDDA